MRVEPFKALVCIDPNRDPYIEDDRPRRRTSTFFVGETIAVEGYVEERTTVYMPRYRPYSTFLAHLIATRDGDPQTRTKRRMDPVTTISSYVETARLPRRRQAGHVISREF